MRTDNNEDPEEIQANSQFEKMRLTMNWIIAVTIFFLRISTGPIEFDVGGVKFKGGGRGPNSILVDLFFELFPVNCVTVAALI